MPLFSVDAGVRAATEAPPTPAPLVTPPGAVLPRPAALAERVRRAVAASRSDAGPRNHFETAVTRAAARHRVDPDLVRAVIRHESDWNPGARWGTSAVRATRSTGCGGNSFPAAP